MEAFLILEDGTVFRGRGIGASHEVISEITFNTSMTGYVEILTDPSYAGQSIVMTYPLIGNYGINHQDKESEKIWADALIVREISRISSNFRSEDTLEHFLEENHIPGIVHVDTRALTKHLRRKGTMNGMITRTSYSNLSPILSKIQQNQIQDVVEKTTVKQKTVQKGQGFRVALLDLGAKQNIAASLQNLGCEVWTYPAFTTAAEILADKPDGMMLSNGPGDPKECISIIKELKSIYDSGIPVFAICLGHQLMALAMGADTYKLKYGHRGGNHPVKDLQTNKITMSSQNHGYVVNADKLAKEIALPAFEHVNDRTNEGLLYQKRPIFSVQFHPEANPGPRDLAYLFERFMHQMEVYHAEKKRD
ncbi:carbamoyl-phosphate synthase small chain [Clostridia bacterium]|nr:carbamoyl-phosphate synthase small chain [Clostridia bacterium]